MLVADDLLAIAEVGVGGNGLHPSLKTFHGIAASYAARRATTVDSQATDKGSCCEGAEDGGGCEMHLPLLMY